MIGGRGAPAWLRPTRRAVDWTPLTLITAALLTTTAVLRWRTTNVPVVVEVLAVAGLGAAAVLGLGDPARPLLQALPTPPIVRLAHRGALIAGATTLAAAVIVATQHLLELRPAAEPELAAAVVALIATGTAVQATASPTIDHAHEAAAGSILLWAATAALPIALVPDALRMAWLEHPWLVTATAAALTVAATSRRSA
ncbi:hypothetical protein BH24ACT5_BH24ACT5_03290 [soil metagenome]